MVLKKILMGIVISSLSLVGQVPNGFAAGGQKNGSLDLRIETAQKAYKFGDPLRLQVVLRNVGKEPLKLFQPDALGKLWPDWKLECTVTRPDGKIFTLEPEITFQMMPQPTAEHYQPLAPNQELTMSLRLGRMKPGENPTTSPWVALIEISKNESRWLSQDLLKMKHRIKGDVYIISGAKDYLAVRDLNGDIFNIPGRYFLEVRYKNNYDSFLSPDSAGERLLPVKVPAAWTGTLTQKIAIDVTP